MSRRDQERLADDGAAKKRKKAVREGPIHPETAHDRIRARMAEESANLRRCGWRFPPGWRLVLTLSNGSKSVQTADSYAEAIALRDAAFKRGGVDEIWICMEQE